MDEEKKTLKNFEDAAERALSVSAAAMTCQTRTAHLLRGAERTGNAGNAAPLIAKGNLKCGSIRNDLWKRAVPEIVTEV